MKPLTPIGSPSPLRLLNKGPEYLRRQMDSGSRGRSVSAVEQLEADKAKYVKSQQVINTKQEPVLVPCATPPPQPRRPFTVPHATTPLQPRKFSAPCASPSPLPRRSFILCDDDVFKDLDAKKENRSLLVHKNIRNIQVTPSVQNPPVLRRSTGKRMLRPDSLIIYRQKRECNTSSRDTKGNSFVKRLFQGSMREKHTPEKLIISEEKSPSKEEDSRMSWANEKESPKSDQSERELFVAPSTPQTSEKRDKETTDTGDESSNPATLRKTGLQRSKSELWLRYSLDLSEKEHFFSYCGLDLEIVDRIGLENFYTASSDTMSLLLRSTSMGGSEPSEFSRRSGEGLFEEEVTEQSPTGVSVIERNARVIKWLYGCRNAKDTPKESTV